MQIKNTVRRQDISLVWLDTLAWICKKKAINKIKISKATVLYEGLLCLTAQIVIHLNNKIYLTSQKYSLNQKLPCMCISTYWQISLSMKNGCIMLNCNILDGVITPLWNKKNLQAKICPQKAVRHWSVTK